MDIGRAFSYISEDVRWMNKLMIGVLLSFVPFLNFAVYGYSIQIARNVANDEVRPLPEWDDLGKLFMDGLRMVGVYLVYMLPAIALLICMITVIAVSIAASETYTSSSGSGTTPFPPQLALMWAVSLFCYMPYSFLLYALLPLFGIQIARTNKFATSFDFREMVRLVRSQPVNYLLILVTLLGLYMAMIFIMIPSYIIAIIPCIGFIIFMLIFGAAQMLMLMVLGHLQGQFIHADNLAQSGKTEAEPGLV